MTVTVYDWFRSAQTSADASVFQILLPRNMTLESSSPGNTAKASFHPMMSAYKRPTPDRLANHHFWEMGQRLNLEQDALAAILPEHRSAGAGMAAMAGGTYELSHSTSSHLKPQSQSHHSQKQTQKQKNQTQTQTFDLPLPPSGMDRAASPPGFRRGSVRNIQEMMGRLAGMDSQRASMPMPPTKIIVTRHEEQRSD